MKEEKRAKEISSDKALAEVRKASEACGMRLCWSPWQPFKGRSPMQLEWL